MVPALFVAYEFAEKVTEVLADPSEFAGIISVIKPLSSISVPLAYLVGFWDLLIGILLLAIPNLDKTKKYSKYIFLWVIFWPLVPSSIRYFGGVADFEIVEVSEMIICALLAYILYCYFNKK